MKFINIISDVNQNYLINVSHTISVKELYEGCEIYLTNDDVIETNQKYEQIIDLINN